MVDQLATKDDMTIVMMVLNELQRRFENEKPAFSYSIKRQRAEAIDSEGDYDTKFEKVTFKNAITKILVDYRPERDSQSLQKDIHYANIEWIPQTGFVEIQLGYLSPVQPGQRHRLNEDHCWNTTIGAGTSLEGRYSFFKKEFIKLMKAVQTYQEVEIPRDLRSKFENAVFETFPHLLDEVMLENFDDKKK